jgi:hypothetical protein|tara:strand:+ start:220 stop:360 length:141 start_codon:yes stop_codon:yes gene_type:complete
LRLAPPQGIEEKARLTATLLNRKIAEQDQITKWIEGADDILTIHTD